jgi:hypothetical protein
MDIDTARTTIRGVFRISSDLQELLFLLKQRCSADEYRQYAIDIARVIDGINVALLDTAIKAYPELESEIDERISTRGHI